MQVPKRNSKRASPKPAQPARPHPPHKIDPPRIFMYVDAVARHGSIRKAAESLHVVSSALNRRILDLEQELGTDLFERLPRGVRPTEAGELFLAYVRRSMRDLDVVGNQIQGLTGLVRGRVRVAVAESVTAHLLPAAVAKFQERHPGVAFHAWVDGPKRLNEALLADSADLILTHEIADHPDVSLLASVTQPLCALVAPDHPLAKRKSVRIGACVAYPVALPDESLAARALIDRVLLRAGLRIEPTMVSNSVELTKTYARWNHAVCFSFRVGGQVDPSGLVEVPLSDPELSHARLFLAARRGRVLPSVAAAFAQQLVQQFEST
ncbi:MAG: LysR family transcriptional regulator [Myxococcales bacterium]